MNTFDPEEEMSAICGAAGGSPVIDCGCGRTNYAGTGLDMDEGELERLDAKRQAEPDKYERHNGQDSVVCVTVLGRTRVFGCPCKWPEKVIAFMDENQDQLLAYFKRKADRLASEAAKLRAAVEGL